MYIYLMTYPPDFREIIIDFFKEVDWYSPYAGTIFFSSYDFSLQSVRDQINNNFPKIMFTLCKIRDVGDIDGLADESLWLFIKSKKLS